MVSAALDGPATPLNPAPHIEVAGSSVNPDLLSRKLSPRMVSAALDGPATPVIPSPRIEVAGTSLNPDLLSGSSEVLSSSRSGNSSRGSCGESHEGQTSNSIPATCRTLSIDSRRAYTWAEVEVATSNCRRQIGKGGFGLVYYGQLGEGQEVAVKINDQSTFERSGQGTQEFINEVSLLLRIHHKNVVSLKGYCEEQGKRILIYDYMAGGTLRQRLYGDELTGKLSWEDRLEIAVDAATGLNYLHNGCDPKIIHRDVKSDNILLGTKDDEKFVGKVSDFGISKQYSNENEADTHLLTAVKGTFGYMDPEYFHTGCLTEKSDVFSFGIVLFEIICGRPPIVRDHPDPKQRSLVEWVRDRVKAKKIHTIVDPEISGACSDQAIWTVSKLALECVELSRSNRPDMETVLKTLKEALKSEKGRRNVR